MALQHESSSDSEKAVRTYGPLAFAIIIALLTTYLLASNIKLNQRVTMLEERAERQGRGRGMGMGNWRQQGGMRRPRAIVTPMPPGLSMATPAPPAQ